MGNALYDHGRENFLQGSIDWDADDIRVKSLDEDDHTVNLATDEDVADLAANSDEFASGALATKTEFLGTADADDLTPAFATASGDKFESIIVFLFSGAEAGDMLICNIDTATGLPLTPDGNNIDITWSSGGDKIFTL